MPSLPLAVLLEFALQHAPQVGSETMLEVIHTESSSDRLTIYDNTGRQAYRSGSKAEAVALAKRLIAQKHSIDAGIAQINSTYFACSPWKRCVTALARRMLTCAHREDHWAG